MNEKKDATLYNAGKFWSSLTQGLISQKMEKFE